MYRVADLIKELDLELVGGQDGIEEEVRDVYIGDLLSWVMTRIRKGTVWITIQTHVNVVAVALLGEAACILVAENAEIDEITILKANEEKIPLLRSKLSSYALAIKINCILEGIK